VPDAEDLRALARSSPWRFTTLRFTHRSVPSGVTVRAWLRRPDVLRVEDAGGALLGVVRGRSSTSTTLVAGWGPVDEPPPEPPPVFRADGLVAVRPPWGDLSQADDPMWQSYLWVAALDPLELADGQDPDTGGPARPLRIGDVREVEHGGRPAWEAEVATTPAYSPRCPCCPLLRDAGTDRAEWDDAAERFAGSVYPTATLVRVDVGTGVCVSSEVLDGTWAGDGHEIVIEAVDEPMDDDLFVEPPRPAEDGWSPFPRPGRQ
jgi:hypothetical protein